MIEQALCTSFKVECLKGVHDLSLGGDVLKMALYDATASLGPTTTAYTATGEISGSGYSAGGTTLTNVTPTSSDTTAMASFSTPVTWSGALTARGALIYNSTKSNKAVAVLDFGSDKTSTTTFSVALPAVTADAAIVRII